jgi:DNA polymerase-3 subunit epsilon
MDDKLQNKADTNDKNIVIYTHPEVRRYKKLIEIARDQLASLETSYSEEKAKVDSITAQLFLHLKSDYQTRDLLKILVQYRALFLQNLLDGDEKSAKKAYHQYEQEKKSSYQEYKKTSHELEGKQKLTKSESITTKKLWKKLVRMFHPDQHDNDQQNRKTYELLTQAINHARDCGNIELLKSIAKNPQKFIIRQGWNPVCLGDSDKLTELQALYKHLQSQILEVTNDLKELKLSEDYKLYKMVENNPSILNDIISAQKENIHKEIKQLQTEADQYEKEIKLFTGRSHLKKSYYQ